MEWCKRTKNLEFYFKNSVGHKFSFEPEILQYEKN